MVAMCWHFPNRLPFYCFKENGKRYGLNSNIPKNTHVQKASKDLHKCFWNCRKVHQTVFLWLGSWHDNQLQEIRKDTNSFHLQNLFCYPNQYLHCFLQIQDRKSTRLNSSHVKISYAVFCLKK